MRHRRPSAWSGGSPRPAVLLLPRRPPTRVAAGLGRLGASAGTKEAPAAAPAQPRLRSDPLRPAAAASQLFPEASVRPTARRRRASSLLASASGPRRVSSASRDGAGAGARLGSSSTKTGPARSASRPGQCPACGGARCQPAGQTMVETATAAPGSLHSRVVPARDRRVHDSVVFGAGPAGLPGARPALRGGWGPLGPELGRNRWNPDSRLLSRRAFSFSSAIKLLPQNPFHGSKSSASPFVSYVNVCELDVLLAFHALGVVVF